jgi:hypothetical protein
VKARNASAAAVLEQPREASGYLDSVAAAVYLGYHADSPNPKVARAELHAFHLCYARNGIPAYRLGRSLRFKKADLEAALQRIHEPKGNPLEAISTTTIASKESAKLRSVQR